MEMNMKSYKKEFSGIGIRMLLSTIIITAVQVGVQTVALLIVPAWKDNITMLLVVTMVPLYVLGFPIAFLLMRNKETPAIEKHSMTAGQLVIAFLMLYGIMIVGNLIGLALTAGIGLLKGAPVQNALLNIVSGGSLWVTAIFTVLCAPVYEEYLFRKLICDKVIKYGEGCAVVVSGLIFGLFHMNFNQFFYAFFLGCFLAFLYVKTGNLKYTILLHMALNFFGSVLGGIILQLDQTNPISLVISAVYSLCIYGIAIAGIVLLIMKRHELSLDPGEITIEKGQRFKTVILNVGMLLFCLVLLAIMIAQAFLL
ncbi:MAG: CPBP family intramembrane metalloprotease [Bacteroidales bacterium]|nr:CPBP family intramembrane metalloprotease [Bacteroidales bacterium]MCM1416326.1 CPBP family intramembrane metalloprotease [bacterium]MCM1423261.1 CPBP family intramembrane metalloprotease [bacterium]